MPVHGYDGTTQVATTPRRYEGAWSDELSTWRVWDGAAWVQVHPDPNAGGALLPVEQLAISAITHNSAVASWQLPTQPTITPTDVAINYPDQGDVWTEWAYPLTSVPIGALRADKPYQIRVKLIQRVNGILVEESPERSIFFRTLVAPIGQPAPDPGGAGGDSLFPFTGATSTPTPPATADGCWWEWKLQLVDLATLLWVDTGITGTVNGDATEVSYDLALLDPTRTYRMCRRSACDTDSDTIADTWGDWECSESFAGLADWAAQCGGIANNITESNEIIIVHSDSFDRANTTPPASIGAWANDSVWRITTNQAELTGTGTSDCPRYDTPLLGSDHFVQADLSPSGDSLWHAAICARMNGASSFYAFHRAETGSNAIYWLSRNSSDDMTTMTQIGPTVTFNLDWISGGEVAADGSGEFVLSGYARMRLEVEGSSLRGYIWNFTTNTWDLAVSVVDTTYPTGTQVGFGGYRALGSVWVDNWKAGTGETAVNVFSDAVYAFPKICLIDGGVYDGGLRIAMIDRVSGIEIGKGPDFLHEFFDGSNWAVQADADGGITMLAPLSVLETTMVPGQDGTFATTYGFDDAHVLSTREYPIAAIGGSRLEFSIVETPTTWQARASMVLSAGLVTVTGAPHPLDGETHTFVLRFDADGDKQLWVDGVLEASDVTGFDWAVSDPTPHYWTATKEFGISGQQVGWNRLLTDSEIIETSGFPEIVGYARSGCTHTTPTAGSVAIPVPTHQVGDLLVFIGSICDPAVAGLTLEFSQGQYSVWSKVAGPSEPATYTFDHIITARQWIQMSAFAIRGSDYTVEDAQLHDSSPPPNTYTGRGLVLAFVLHYGCANIEFLQPGVTQQEHWNFGLPSGTRNLAVAHWNQLAVGPPTPADYIYGRGYGGSCSAGSDDDYDIVSVRIGTA